jgi:hypothetical protein
MTKPRPRRFPVTVTRLPVVRCEICRRTVAHRPGQASQVLTEHYRREHPDALGLNAPSVDDEAPQSPADLADG